MISESKAVQGPELHYRACIHMNGGLPRTRPWRSKIWHDTLDLKS
jgi:hypothetical protein